MFAPRSLTWVLLFFSLLGPNPARADGKVFARAAGPVQVPDQRAMLYFSNGVERLVIETSFVGEGTNFAWVVPLPSAPRIEAVSTNFFRTLNASFQPRLIHRLLGIWPLNLSVGIAVGIGIWAYRRSHRWLFGLTASSIVLLILVISIVPDYVVSRGATIASPRSSVNVLDRRTVGVYDTVTLAGRDGSELLGWLNQNGFRTPSNALPVIAGYAAQQWVFVAATIRRESAGENRSQPHPLAFTFNSEKAVYPLRLTGVENDHCSIELFVFGPERAEADGFQVEHCGRPFVPEPVSDADWSSREEYFGPPAPGEYRISAPEIRGWVMPAAVTTKLVGTLRPENLQADAWIRWVPYHPELPVLYTRDAARNAVLNLFSGILVVGAVVIQLSAARHRRRTCWFALLLLCAATGAGGALMLGSMKTTEVEYVRGWTMNDYHHLESGLLQVALEQKTGIETFEELMTALSGCFRGPITNSVKNVFSNGPLKNEATPGNITLESTPNGVRVLWHDIDGLGHEVATFDNAAPPK